MNINYENNNVVKLKGKIIDAPIYSHQVLGEGFFESKLEVKRLSGEKDILPITFSERIIKNLSIGDEIALIGQFRSYNKVEDKHSKLMLTVFVREIVDPKELDTSNNITMIGYVCKPPIYRTTPFGREIADILLAVNRAYNKSDYLPCIAWGRNARFVQEMQVGEKIEVTGRVQSRNYQKRTETSVITKTAYEISISGIRLADADGEFSYTRSQAETSFEDIPVETDEESGLIRKTRAQL